MRRVPCPLLGVEVDLPDRPQRIVSLSPSLTDGVIRLGLQDRLVGRSAWCWRPRGVEELPVVGSYTGVRRRALDRLEPDLVLATSGVQEPLARELAGAGLPVFVVPLPVTPWGILDNLGVLAEVTGESRAAFGPLEALHRTLGFLRNVCEPLPVYVEIDLGGPITPGPGSYVHWALRWMGLSPVTPPGGSAWTTPRDAWLASIRPRAIVYDPQPRRAEDENSIRRRLVARGMERWFDENPKIVVTEGDVIAHYGPWLIEEGLPALADALGPRAG